MEIDLAKEYFSSSVSDRDRAIFEGGITLGSLYHQFVGTPIGNKKILEKNITESALTHPFIVDAKTELKVEEKSEDSPYEYQELSGEMMKIRITAEFGSCRVKMGIKYMPEVDFPLMYISEIND
ncbi:MAG: dihydroneopterin aldolase family protein [Candidatus Hadarchaeota archaeon]